MYKLLVVGNKTVAERIKTLIDWRRFDITRIEECSGFRDALRLAKNYQPHIVICDIQLKDGWGFELISAFKAARIPGRFIILGESGEFEYVRKSFLLGAKDFLLKPPDKTKLEQNIIEIIDDSIRELVRNTWRRSKRIDFVTRREYSSFSHITKKVIQIIRLEYDKNLTLKSIAQRLVMNSKYIGQLFIQDTGLRFSEYLFVFRISLAKELIVTTDIMVRAIAEKTGFFQINRFYSLFKSFYGVSPRELRALEGTLINELEL